MKIQLTVAAVALAFAAGVMAGGGGARADEPFREALRQQSAAERASCAGIQRTLSGGTDATLVVRTALELGYNSCQVIRCALEAGADLEKVVQGAAAAGVQPDVITRCSIEAGAETGAVAAALAAALLDPNYCYFAPQPGPPVVLPAVAPVIDRSLPTAQASPFIP